MAVLDALVEAPLPDEVREAAEFCEGEVLAWLVVDYKRSFGRKTRLVLLSTPIGMTVRGRSGFHTVLWEWSHRMNYSFKDNMLFSQHCPAGCQRRLHHPSFWYKVVAGDVEKFFSTIGPVGHSSHGLSV